MWSWNTSQSTASTEKVEEEVEEEVSTPSKQIPATLSSSGGLANVELVLPLKSTPTVTAGIPEAYLPICGPLDPFPILLPVPILLP